MWLDIYGGELYVDRKSSEEIIEKELKKMSKEELIKMLLDRDGEYLDLEEYFREEITEQIKPDCISD